MPEIAITGAAGFIGSHLTETLLSQGRQVLGIDDLSTGSRHNLSGAFENPKFSFEKEDACNANKMLSVCKGVEIIFHEAALVGSKLNSALKPLLINTDGTKVMLDVARRNDAKFILASTSEIYGKNTSNPMKENDDRILGSTAIPRWAYSTSKAFDEHLVLGYAKEYGLKAVILRYFNVYGPRATTGWRGGVLPSFISNALHNKPLIVHSDGMQKRTFTYVSDIVDGTIEAAKNKSAENDVFNIGGGELITIKALAEKVISLCKSKSSLKFVPYEEIYGNAFEDVRMREPDIHKAKKILNYQPKISLNEGLKSTIDYFKSL